MRMSDCDFFSRNALGARHCGTCESLLNCTINLGDDGHHLTGLTILAQLARQLFPCVLQPLAVPTLRTGTVRLELPHVHAARAPSGRRRTYPRGVKLDEPVAGGGACYGLRVVLERSVCEHLHAHARIS